MPPFAVEVLNVLGAGDAFASGFIYGHLRATPDEVRMVLVDPKRVELVGYNDIPLVSHLSTPLTSVRVPFDQIAGAVRRVRAGAEDLHIAVNASLSVKWLIPRLGRFQAQHPRIRLHLSELAAHATSHRGAQAVVRIVPLARTSEPDCTAFIRNALGAVMSPETAARCGGDPLRAPRLAAATHPEAWTIFAEHAGIELPPAPERSFPHVHFALDAALVFLVLFAGLVYLTKRKVWSGVAH